MKRLLSFLLAVTVVLSFALSAMATDAPDAVTTEPTTSETPESTESTESTEAVEELEITIDQTDVVATTAYSTVNVDSYYDETTGEESFSPEYTYYPWYHTCAVTVTINGTTYENISLETLSGAIAGGAYGALSGGVSCDQSYENQWQVGGTYNATYYIFRMDGDGETIWSTDLRVTLEEPPVAISLTNIEVDEIYGQDYGDFTFYPWEEGTLTATIDGTEYKNVSYKDLSTLLEEKYGPVNCFLRNSPNSGHEDELNQLYDQSAENPWEIGETVEAELIIDDAASGVCLYREVLTVQLCETKVASVSVAPISYYAYQGYVTPEITLNYKDGTSAVAEGLFYEYSGEWPEEPGTYTMDITVAGLFTAPVQITVLANPTSGKLTDTLSWTYDEASETLTVSGTGSASEELEDLDSWGQLLLALEPKHAVVETGVEYLPLGAFVYGIYIEDISLPTTLQELPDALIAWNGPSEDSPAMDGEKCKGMSSITVPEGVTSLTNSIFYLCWGISDFYLPSTIQEIDLDTLCYVNFCRAEMGADPLATTIHFAGTEEQWAQVEHVTGSRTFPTGMTDSELEEMFATFTVVFEPKITVEDGTATVPDSVVEITEGKDVVIDVTQTETETEEKVESVVIGSETVSKIADAQAAVEIKLSDATVSFDAAAVGSIGTQAGESAVTVVAKEVEETALTSQQTAALEDKEVLAVLTLEVFAGETKITDFGGGKVTVSVPFQLPEGKVGTDYYVAYVAADGTVTVMPTTYANGVLTFETTHFSNYVVVEKTSNTNTEPSDPPATEAPSTGGSSTNNGSPQTGDSSQLTLLAVLLVTSAACLVFCATQRRRV